MAKYFKTIGKCILKAILMLSLGSCQDSHETSPPPIPRNYIIVLDLSDRILKNHVPETDQLMIKTVFELFVSNVRQNLTIRSTDKLKLRILPQQGSRLDFYTYENNLSIDMATLDISQKNTVLTGFSNNFSASLASLYNDAYQGPLTRNYFGCDIWKYFNEQLRADLEKGCVNSIIILTDGYFDFENSSHAMRKGNLFTSSDFYALFTGPEWKNKAKSQDYGLIPVNLARPFSCIICGLNPKTDRLTELEKLEYFWAKWMHESNADTCFFISMTSSEKMKHELIKRINCVLK